ncbi:MAG: PilN domain-containing protein [Phycisphaerales bacterium JB059]
MRFGQPRLILNLTPNQMDAVLVSGKRVRASKRAKLSPALWEEAWNEGLSPFDSTLTSLLRALGAPKNVKTSVLYTSPDSISEVRTAPGSGEDGVEAARLEVIENITSVGLEHISSAARLTHDEGPDVLVVADRDLNAQSIFAWLARCSCRFDSIIPLRAIALRAVIRDVTTRVDDGAITCYLGERTSIIASGGSGALRSVRCIDFGYSLLVEALSRGLRQDVEEGGASEVCAHHAEARKRLFEVGLPTAKGGAVGPEVSRRVMPLLQPVLQRYFIEIKQTIRFGIPDSSGASRTLRLIGPGAAIGGFPDLISNAVDTEIQIDGGWDRFNPDEIYPAHSPEQDFIAHGAAGLGLAPRIVREIKAARIISAGVRTGAMCAALALVAEAGTLYARQLEVRQAIRASEASLASVRQHRELTEIARRMSESFEIASSKTAEALEGSPDWYAVLAELAQLSNEGVTFNSFRAYRDANESVVVIDGIAQIGGEHANTLANLTDQLRSSPLYHDVQLGSTSLAELGGEPARRFELRLKPRAFAPWFNAVAEAAPTDPGVTP